jgi:hypothetical protein
MGNFTGLDEGIPAVLAQVAVSVHEQAGEVTDGQLAGTWIDREGLAATATATGDKSGRPEESLKLAEPAGAQVEGASARTVRENQVDMAGAGVAVDPAQHGRDLEDFLQVSRRLEQAAVQVFKLFRGGVGGCLDGDDGSPAAAFCPAVGQVEGVRP